MYGPTRENGTGRMKHNRVIRYLYDAPYVVTEATSRRLSWAGYLIWGAFFGLIKQKWEDNPDGRRPTGLPKKKWKDEFLNKRSKMRVSHDDAEDQKK